MMDDYQYEGERELEKFLEDMSGTVYNTINPASVFALLMDYQARRDAEYERSWAKRGLIGWWAGGICRCMDRVSPVFRTLVFGSLDMDSKKKCDDAVLTLFDTLVDVACYAVMGICMLAKRYPVLWDTYCKDTLVDMEHANWVQGVEVPDSEYCSKGLVKDIEGIVRASVGRRV